MDSKVLTLKYRPQNFEQLLIQDHVRDTLRRAIERNRIANAYLFAGPRGVGKTTTARILAKSLNCLSYDKPTLTPCGRCSACVEIAGSRSIDVLEIDGASERKIEDVRELREGIRYAPSSLRYKVYIIDEIHMLTKEAFNAILKTLEEPPAHARFIFATTEAHKLPLTILSRCQRFDFRKATVEEVLGRVRWVAEREKITIAPDAAAAIAVRADGAIRDAESMLEQSAMYAPEGVGLADVEELFGIVPSRMYFEYVGMILDGDAAGLLGFVDRVFETGYDFLEFWKGIVEHLRHLLLSQYGAKVQGLLPDEEERVAAQARRFSRGGLLRAIDKFCQDEDLAKHAQLPRALLEIVSLELAIELGPSEDSIAPPVARETAADPTPTAGPRSADEIWQDLRLRVNEHKPMLASLLDLAAPAGFEDDTLSLTLPARNCAAAEKLKAESRPVERILSEIVGRPARLAVSMSRADSKPDPTLDHYRRVFGDVEEERK